LGHDRLPSSGDLILNRTLFQLQKKHDGGFRATPGAGLGNESDGEAIHAPPQEAGESQTAMAALEEFINVDEAYERGPLIKMAPIHHQFEGIHPFSDGNGRINHGIYLNRTGLLDTPILSLLREITETAGDHCHGAAICWERWPALPRRRTNWSQGRGRGWLRHCGAGCRRFAHGTY
jgi:hypothetical protein